MNWWNMFNARVIGKNKSVFSGLGSNAKFSGILLFIAVVTILVVQFGGEFFQTEPLSLNIWLMIFALTSPVVIVRELYFQLIGKKK
jgi:Ca2+-transporting ATPase